MSNEDTRKSRINTLKAAQEARKQDSKNRVYQAIERLQKINAKINFQIVAREANVSVSYLYKYPEIKQHIAELRSKQNSLPVKILDKPNSKSHAKILTRLRERIKKLEENNKELKRKCKALAGRVYRVHLIQEQVERLQEENENLRTKLTMLGEQYIAKKVTPIDKNKKAKSSITDKIQSKLDDLGVELNTTLTKTINAATEETVLDAIEALKEQVTRKNIPNPGGWLNKAIKEGWTKSESNRSKPPQSKFVTATDQPKKQLVPPDKLKQLSNLFNSKDD